MSELELHLQRALSKLPEKCRVIFHLSRFEELKYQDIAGQLNIFIKTVEAQMSKALKILRRELKEFLPVITFMLFWEWWLKRMHEDIKKRRGCLKSNLKATRIH